MASKTVSWRDVRLEIDLVADTSSRPSVARSWTRLTKVHHPRHVGAIRV
jgi:hypothetical protein